MGRIFGRSRESEPEPKTPEQILAEKQAAIYDNWLKANTADITDPGMLEEALHSLSMLAEYSPGNPLVRELDTALMEAEISVIGPDRILQDLDTVDQAMRSFADAVEDPAMQEIEGGPGPSPESHA